MNVCTFSGRVGRDPELARMPQGDPVLGWSLAVDTGTRDKPSTMWIGCRIIGKRAEALAPYIAKGAKLVVSGRLAQDEYQSKSGETRTALRLTVDQVELPPKGEASAAAPAPAERKAPTRRSDFDDEIPF